MSSDEIKKRTVYMLRRTDGGNDIYIGSTSQPLKGRYMRHMYRAKNFIKHGCSKDTRLYTRMNEVGLDNWRISPLLSRMCDIKTIREEEKEWVRALKAGLNTYSPVTDQKEYMATYYKNNRETISQQNKAYYKNNKDAIKEYQTGYYKSNLGAIKEYKATYSKNNKGTRRFYCDVCGVAFGGSYDLKRHLKSLKHSNTYMNSVD